MPKNLLPNLLAALGLAGAPVCVAALAGGWWGGLLASVEAVGVGYLLSEGS